MGYFNDDIFNIDMQQYNNKAVQREIESLLKKYKVEPETVVYDIYAALDAQDYTRFYVNMLYVIEHNKIKLLAKNAKLQGYRDAIYTICNYKTIRAILLTSLYFVFDKAIKYKQNTAKHYSFIHLVHLSLESVGTIVGVNYKN